MVTYFDGILKIANIVLSLVAGYIGLSLFTISSKKKSLYPWKILIIALIFFVLQEILGALRSFNIYTSPFLTHIIPGVILILLIYALTIQIIQIKYNTN